MKISVEYEPGLKKRLLSSGIMEGALLSASRVIQEQFEHVACQVYERTLRKPLHDAIEVVVNSDNRMEGEKYNGIAASATCTLKNSEKDPIRFSVCESLAKNIIKGHEPSLEFIATVTHEMVHSAHADTVSKTIQVLVDLEVATMGVNGPLEEDDWQRYKGLLFVLSIFHHFCREGVAMLGACLLAKCRFEAAPDDLHVFRRIFVRTFRQAAQEGWDKDDFDFEEWAKYKAYKIAPDILVKVLAAREIIDSETEEKIFQGFKTGHYDLTEQEIGEVMRSAIALTLPEYIEGLLTPDKDGFVIGHLTEFFNYCGWHQQNVCEEGVKAFCEVMRQPFNTASEFNEAMQTILGEQLPKETLFDLTQSLLSHPVDEALYPGLTENVTKLQLVAKENKQVSRWATTYFFSEKGLVSNDIPILGRVDDMMVIDKALKVVNERGLEEYARFLISNRKKANS